MKFNKKPGRHLLHVVEVPFIIQSVQLAGHATQLVYVVLSNWNPGLHFIQVEEELALVQLVTVLSTHVEVVLSKK